MISGIGSLKIIQSKGKYAANILKMAANVTNELTKRRYLRALLILLALLLYLYYYLIFAYHSIAAAIIFSIH